MKIFITSVITLLVSFSSLVCFSAEHVVKMLSSGTEGSMIFEPSVLRIAVGDSVTFEATEPGHNSTDTHYVAGGRRLTFTAGGKLEAVVRY